MKNKVPYKRHLSNMSSATRVTDAGKFNFQIINLQSFIESLRTQDGAICVPKWIKIHLRADVEVASDTPAARNVKYGLIAVQTNGTWTHTAGDTVNSRYEDILGESIDDVFSYECIGCQQAVKEVPVTYDPPLTQRNSMSVQRTINIPRRLLLLASKQAETERFQDIKIGILGTAPSAVPEIDFSWYFETEYQEARKGIVY